jgi:hypothetical protein
MKLFEILILICILFPVLISCEDQTDNNFPDLTIWRGNITLYDDFIVGAGCTLHVEPGTHIVIYPNKSIIAVDGGKIEILGTEDDIITISCSDASLLWGNIHASSRDSSLTIRHAEISSGYVKVSSYATGLIEDSYIHDYINEAVPIIFAFDAEDIVIRRCHVVNYYEINLVSSPSLVEDCVFEYMIGDGIDFDSSPEETLLQRTTIKNGIGYNIDAIDFGLVFYLDRPPTNGTVLDCHVYNISDKGVSVGEGTENVHIENTLINNVGSGISVKDSSVVEIVNVTIACSDYGLNFYEERETMDGGIATAYNCIIWDNTASIQLLDDSTLTINYSDIEGGISGITGASGNNNLDMNPLFNVDFSVLNPGSPTLGTGLGGSDIGVQLPVGGE